MWVFLSMLESVLGLLYVDCIGATLVINLGVKADGIAFVQTLETGGISNLALVEKGVLFLTFNRDKPELLAIWFTLNNACIHRIYLVINLKYPATITDNEEEYI